MTLTEIKKELYKQNPDADFILADKEHLYYECSLKSGQVLFFWVPVKDIGDGKFNARMAAKHLIRYIVTPENNTPNDKG